MEKKKLLLVAVSVGIFLIIVIGLSILIFLPKNRAPTAASRVVSRNDTPSSNTVINPEPPAEPKEPATMDAVEMLRNREEVGRLQSTPSIADRNNGSSLVIEVPSPSSAAVPNSRSAGGTGNSTPSLSSSEERSLLVKPPSPPPGADIIRPSNTVPAAASPRPVSDPPPAAVRQVQPARARDNYWVQAGSFSTHVKAEDVKETLAAKGITAIIENRDVNGKNFFRVRIGPYTSQNEADYWLALIKTINGFENSQIWQSQSSANP
jgi:DedD protein